MTIEYKGFKFRTKTLKLLTPEQAKTRGVLQAAPDVPEGFVFWDGADPNGFMWLCGKCAMVLAIFMGENAILANGAFLCRKCGAINDADLRPRPN